MSTLEQMYEKAQQFAEEVEADILNDNFQLIKEGKCTYIVSVLHTKLEIWIANEPSCTRIYCICNKDHADNNFPLHHFKDPHAVRNALMAYTINSMEDKREEHY